jgi:hypothetical protein
MTTATLFLAVLAALASARPAKPTKAERPSKPPATQKEGPLAVGESKVSEVTLPVDAMDDARKVADAYLRALTGEGDDKARDTLLGGATLNARLETLANARVVEREPHKSEQGELADVHANVDNLDRAARQALSQLLGGGPAAKDDPDGLGVDILDASQAQQVLAPTRARAAAFFKSHPVFAYVLRVDREVFWHPKNPARKLLADAGLKGRYQLDFHLFRVETVEGSMKKAKVWPLRVVRMRTDTMDTGWKVLPASDWNAE